MDRINKIANKIIADDSRIKWMNEMANYADKHNFLSVTSGEIRNLIKSLDIYPDYTTTDILRVLARRGVPEDEIEELKKKVKLKKTRVDKNKFDYIKFEEGIGKSIATVGDVSEYGKQADIIIKAVKKLKGKAKVLWKSEVRKVIVTSENRPKGRWDSNGEMRLSLAGNHDVTSWVHTITHELGHSLEDKLHLRVTPWDETPYGQEPYVTRYAEMNATEDFAETFRAIILEPSLLKGKAPEKYKDMKSRL